MLGVNAIRNTETMKIRESFTHLPPEITTSIMSLLSVSELLVLSCVNSTFNRFAEEILYRNVELVWKRKRRERRDARREPQFLKLHTFLFSILGSSRRSACVQHLHIDTGDLLGVWGLAETRLTKMEFDLAEGAISLATQRVDDRKQWLANLIDGVPNAYIALLLLQVRNIRSLDLGISNLNSKRNFHEWSNNSPIQEVRLPETSEAALRQRRIPDTGFTRLQKFRYSILEDYPRSSIYALPTEIDKDHILPFFKAPNISSISLYLFSAQEIFLNSPVVATTITELILERYNLGLTQLERLILATPNLQILKLNYWVNCDDAASSSKPHMDIQGLFRILYSIRGSLQELQLSTRFWRSTAGYATSYAKIKDHGGDYDDPTTHWGLKGSMPSLKDFKQLRVLELPTPVLLGWNGTPVSKLAERLPCALSKLVLRDDLWEWARYAWSPEVLWRELQMFIGCECQSMPTLHEVIVTVSCNKMENQDTRSTIKGLKAPFKHRDITLGIAIYEDDFTPSGDCSFPLPSTPPNWDDLELLGDDST